MKVRIKNHVYPCVKAAAKAKGVSTSTIYAAMERGTIDNVGAGQGRSETKNHNGGRKPKPVTIGPVTFASRAEASRVLGYGTQRGVGHVLNNGKKKAKEGLMLRVLAYHASMERCSRNETGGGECCHAASA